MSVLRVSKSLPVEFWRESETTYNERVGGRVEKFCFNQSFKCSDEIKFQLTELDSEGEENEFALQIINILGTVINTVTFIDTRTEVKAVLSALTAASNNGSGVTWTLGATPTINITVDEVSKNIRVPITDGIANLPLEFDITLTPFLIGSPGYGFRPRFFLYSADMAQSVEVVGDDYIDAPNVAIPITVELTPTFTPAFLVVTVEYIGDEEEGNIASIDLNSAVLNNIYYSRNVFDLTIIPSDDAFQLCESKVQFKMVRLTEAEPEIAYKSDYVLISDNLFESIQINYKSNKNFNGLAYETTPGYFSIRFPGIFFEETHPMTMKALALSNSKVINTAVSIEDAMLLELEDMPYHMHKKLKLILMHAASGDVLIKGVGWTLKNDYEYNGNRPKSYPMKAGQILLTKRTGYEQNII